MDLDKALTISASGMSAQSTRLRVVAENLANQETTSTSPGGSAYRRKTVTFESRLDKAASVERVVASRIGQDMSDLPTRYDPANPASNVEGYVQLPNVNPLVEMMDMRDAERTYAANLAVMQTTRSMLDRAIELLK